MSLPTPILFHIPAQRAEINLTHKLNRLTPNDPYMGRNAPLTSKRCILCNYSTNTGTEYFKHALYSPFFFSSKCSLFHNANLYGSCIIHILYTGCAKIKKNNSGAKGLSRLPFSFPTRNAYAFQISPTRATKPTNLIVLHLLILRKPCLHF